jgi:hypothetical protein
MLCTVCTCKFVYMQSVICIHVYTIHTLHICLLNPKTVVHLEPYLFYKFHLMSLKRSEITNEQRISYSKRYGFERHLWRKAQRTRTLEGHIQYLWKQELLLVFDSRKLSFINHFVGLWRS